MGTDCGIAILKDGVFKREYVGRYYAFDVNNIETMTFMSEQKFLDVLSQSKECNANVHEYDKELLEHCYDLINDAYKIVSENRGAVFAFYNDNDWDEDKVESYKFTE